MALTTQQTVDRHRRIHRYPTQTFPVAEVFLNVPGAYVKLDNTIRGCKEIMEGKDDDMPESAFDMKGGIDEVTAAHAEKTKEDKKEKAAK